MPLSKPQQDQVNQAKLIAEGAGDYVGAFKEMQDLKGKVTGAAKDIGAVRFGTGEENFNKYKALNEAKGPFYHRLRRRAGFPDTGVAGVDPADKDPKVNPQPLMNMRQENREPELGKAPPLKMGQPLNLNQGQMVDPSINAALDAVANANFSGTEGLGQYYGGGFIAGDPDSPMDKNIGKELDKQFMLAYKALLDQRKALHDLDVNDPTVASDQDLLAAKAAVQAQIDEMERLINNDKRARNGWGTSFHGFGALVEQADEAIEITDKHYYRRAQKDLAKNIVESSRHNERNPGWIYPFDSAGFELSVVVEDDGSVSTNVDKVPIFSSAGRMYAAGAVLGANIEGVIRSTPVMVEEPKLDEDGNPVMKNGKPVMQKVPKYEEVRRMEVDPADPDKKKMIPAVVRDDKGVPVLDKDGKEQPVMDKKIVYQYGDSYEDFDAAIKNTTTKINSIPRWPGMGCDYLMDQIAVAEAMGTKIDPELYDPNNPKWKDHGGFNPAKLDELSKGMEPEPIAQMLFKKMFMGQQGQQRLQAARNRVDKNVLDKALKDDARREVMQNPKAHGLTEAQVNSKKSMDMREVEKAVNKNYKEVKTKYNELAAASPEKAAEYRRDKVRGRFIDMGGINREAKAERNRIEGKPGTPEGMRIVGTPTPPAPGLVIKGAPTTGVSASMKAATVKKDPRSGSAGVSTVTIPDTGTGGAPAPSSDASKVRSTGPKTK